jgi:hypothetical protein
MTASSFKADWTAGQQVVASAQFLIDSEASLRGIMPAQPPGSSAQPDQRTGFLDLCGSGDQELYGARGGR